ncbi:Zinc finger, c2h2 [Globisporangium polare]
MAASGASDDAAVCNGAAPPTTALAQVAAPTAAAASVSVAATAWTDSSARERIAGSPLVPDCVQWADDGRVAVVSDASVMISTFMSRELEMFMQQSPAVSKSFIFLPESAERERVPIDIPEFDEPMDSAMSSGGMTYFLLHEADRHQYNPKELSLSKNEGRAFLSATWGPRGSGPNSSCALLTLMSSSRIALHFSSSFHLSWQEVAVFSETLFEFFEKAQFKMRSSTKGSASNGTTNKTPAATAPEPTSGRATKKRRRSSMGVATTTSGSLLESTATSSVVEYAHKCSLLATMTVAWSPFVLSSEHSTTSLIAFSGRKVSTVWGYAFPSFASSEDAASGNFSGSNTSNGSLLSPAPVAWVDTEKHGWVATSTWQQMHYERAKPTESLTLAMGTVSGNVLLANVPVVSESFSDGFPPEAPVDRVILAPHCQPVFNICLGSRDTYGDSLRNDLVVASGSTISVWNVNRKRPTPVSWKAHDGNITGLSTNYFGDAIFSCGVDGKIKVWDKERATEIPFKTSSQPSASSNSSSASETKYPLFGLAVSPSSAQVVCVHIIPPAARPNRKSQADVSYSRVSSALEYLPSPSAKDPESFVQSMCRVLEESKSGSTFTDVLWFCHEDNAAITSLHGSSDMTIPNLLNKLKGVSGADTTTDTISRQPLYLNLCESLEQKYLKAVAENQAVALGDRRMATGVLAKQSRGFTPILYLQASYLLRSSIPPAENHVVIRDAALMLLRRTLYGYWAERSLTELVSTHSQVDNFAGISHSEKLSALLMADFLSIQEPLSEARERLVTTVYTRLGSEEGDHVGDWLAHLQSKTEVAMASATDSEATKPPPTPPSRQTCFICEQPVPFAEFELFCVSGHVQERCFLSFQVIASMDSWKCMGCGALACELLLDDNTPFYLLESERDTQTSGGKATRISCRLCGNFCSFFKY